MSKTMAKYLVTSSAYIRGKTVAEGATQAQPQVIELDASIDPSRKWLPVNRAAQEALARLDVHVEIVPEPGAKPAPREAATMSEIARATRKMAADRFNGPRLSDTSPLGDPVVPHTSKTGE